jgi:serine/threonine-protein kinase
MDFGVAGQAKSTLVKTQSSVLAGTPVYMAPEADGDQIRRESDIFSLGVCFFEMLSGKLPFEGEGNAFLVHKVQGKRLKISSLGIPGLPAAALDEIFDRALNPDPEKRYHGVGELWAQIVALAPKV